MHELAVLGIFISPLLPCMIAAFITRIGVSKLLEKLGVYRWVAQRPLFDTALFFCFIGAFFYAYHTMVKAIP